jgi:exodeoxyribonuclease III
LKFDYKLKWFRRLATQAKALLAHEVPVMLVGDFNVMPTELDLYKPEKYLDNALFRKEVRAAYHRLLGQGWTDA